MILFFLGMSSSSNPETEPITSGQLDLTRLTAALRRGNLRMTPARRSILEALLAERRPQSLEELQEAARKSGEHPDYTTVFRLMTVLEELGLVQKLSLHQSRSQYELIDPDQHYDHIVCRKCGKITLIEGDCPVEAVEKRISRTYGFEELTHNLEFHGICPQCQAA